MPLTSVPNNIELLFSMPVTTAVFPYICTFTSEMSSDPTLIFPVLKPFTISALVRSAPLTGTLTTPSAKYFSNTAAASAPPVRLAEILRTLGRIHEKRVFKAASSADGKVIAIRPIPGNGERPLALIDTARRAMTLESPNIVQVQEVTESDGESYVVTEYVEGNDLRSLMKQNAGVFVWDATDIARQICSAIDHARLR